MSRCSFVLVCDRSLKAHMRPFITKHETHVCFFTRFYSIFLSLQRGFFSIDFICNTCLKSCLVFSKHLRNKKYGQRISSLWKIFNGKDKKHLCKNMSVIHNYSMKADRKVRCCKQRYLFY